MIANLTRLEDGRRCAVHLLNYDPEPARNVRVRLNLAGEPGGRPRLVTPDSATAGLGQIQRAASGLAFLLDTLDLYGVVVLE